ncbi:hypothetical protein AVEN_149446-1 [Araneus ventricosus]|uniref:Uncharacterized protein n=1 Tax=Araneus ventricosus TaxID=182803 RepID=A0A4Y2JE96_ARAVE|nr:hypothetical protein AVEN_149446-1 [Araneus ventricosus]
MQDLAFHYRTPKAVVLKDILIAYEKDPDGGYRVENTPPVFWVPKNRTWNTILESSSLRLICLLKFCTITEESVMKFIAQQNRKQSKS